LRKSFGFVCSFPTILSLVSECVTNNVEIERQTLSDGFVNQSGTSPGSCRFRRYRPVDKLKNAFRYRVITTDGTESGHQVEMSTVQTLKELCAELSPHLDWDTMMHVDMLLGGHPADMFVDDLGIPKDLPHNEKATVICRANRMRKHPKDNPENLPHIAGPVVFFEEIVWS
jgi:hypothetical protein